MRISFISLSLAVIGSLGLAACVHESQTPPAPVSQTQTTSGKVPVADESPLGPADYGFGHSLSATGGASTGNVDPGSRYNNRQNPGSLSKDSNQD